MRSHIHSGNQSESRKLSQERENSLNTERGQSRQKAVQDSTQPKTVVHCPRERIDTQNNYRKTVIANRKDKLTKKRKDTTLR